MQSKRYRDNRFNPKRLAEALETTTDCFACGNELIRFGMNPDEDAVGVCDRCGEETVAPVGDMSITGQHDEPNFEGSVTLTLDARDESDREFTYTVEVADGDPELRSVEIAGKRVRPDSPYWDAEALWVGAVERAVAEYERERLDGGGFGPVFGGDET
jgi:hypothetical protein